LIAFEKKRKGRDVITLLDRFRGRGREEQLKEAARMNGNELVRDEIMMIAQETLEGQAERCFVSIAPNLLSFPLDI
jgi:hypothetical protein